MGCAGLCGGRGKLRLETLMNGTVLESQQANQGLFEWFVNVCRHNEIESSRPTRCSKQINLATRDKADALLPGRHR
jgi:hypothetical protein